MKRLLGLTLIMIIALGGTYLVFGSDDKKPEETNFSIINETGKNLKKIGIGNNDFATILTDVNNDNLEKNAELFFNIDKLNNNGTYCVKAIDNNDNVFETVVKISKNDSLKIEGIEGTKLLTNKDVDEKVDNTKFNIQKLIEHWEYKIENKKIKSRFKCKYKNRIEVLDKNLRLKRTEIAPKDNESTISVEKGRKNYSWVNIYY